ALALLHPHCAVTAPAQAATALCDWQPLARGLAVAGRPLLVARPWSAIPAGGLALASHLCMQTTCMWPPLHRRQRLLSLPIAATSVEIVYPCIPDPDGEDEGGQASSSLAISTQWISVVKLLQSDLATLAQREGGEYEVVAKAAAYQP
ncbi:hypothetical protein GW17_00052489, partial [Ensete ventricosum]